MALERGKLTNVVAVSAGATVGIVTVASNKKVYIKSIVASCMGDIGDMAGIQTGKAHVYFVPNNGGSAGDPARSNQIFNIDLFINALTAEDAMEQFDRCQFENRNQWKILVELGQQPA